MTKMRVLTAIVASVLAVTAHADATEGHVLAFDRVAGIIILIDKTVWQLGDKISVPDDLASGDRVLLKFASLGEEGVTSISALTRLATTLPADTDGGS